MLETFLLDGHDDYDVQNFAPAPDGCEPHALFYLRQAHSIANQLNKERVLDECWGAGGHDSTPADWSRIGRWLIVHGVNLLNPHLSLLTIRGTRKVDHPQTFSDHSPWFEHLRAFNDELTRLCWISNQGTTAQRILLLDPLTTGFCVARKADCLPAHLQAKAGHAAAAPPAEEQFRSSLASFAQLQQDASDLAQRLSDAQADFDIGDEYVLEEFGRVDGPALVVGRQTYAVVIWPGSMTNLRSATAAMLESYLAGGGRLFGVRPGELTVDGRPSGFLEVCEERFPEQCQWFATNADLIEAVQTMVPPRFQVDHPPVTGLAHMRRVLATSDAFLIVNSSSAPVESRARVETTYSHLYTLAPVSGAICALDVSRDGATLVGQLHIKARGATVVLATDEAIEETGRPAELRVAPRATALEVTGVVRSEPNVLVIDSCELEMGGKSFPSEAVYAANERWWRGHGMETNGWFGVIQYRDQVLAANQRMAATSGGTVTYRVSLAEGVDTSSIQLALELPELWQVSVNGTPVDVAAGQRWLDDHIRAAPIGERLHVGDNLIRLDGHPFDVRREIDQIYLLGEFAGQPANPGFTIAPPVPLQLGSWRAQGLPFYDREVAYSCTLPATGPGVLTVADDDWAGSLLVVEQGGQIVSRLWEPPYQVLLDPSRGQDMTIRIIGLPKNLLGPWHPSKPFRRRAWMSMWFGPDVPTAPQPGANYDLLDLGLFGAPSWSVVSA